MKVFNPLLMLLSLAPALIGAAPVVPDLKPVRVLFLGNSFTARSNLPDLVRILADAGTPSLKLETMAITYGGMTLQYHWISRNGAMPGSICATPSLVKLRLLRAG